MKGGRGELPEARLLQGGGPKASVPFVLTPACHGTPTVES
jgi:hypothetical protein